MSVLAELALVAVGAAIVNNVVLSQFLGICPFLGVSKNTKTAAGMGGAVILLLRVLGTGGVYSGRDKPSLPGVTRPARWLSWAQRFNRTGNGPGPRGSCRIRMSPFLYPLSSDLICMTKLSGVFFFFLMYLFVDY